MAKSFLLQISTLDLQASRDNLLMAYSLIRLTQYSNFSQDTELVFILSRLPSVDHHDMYISFHKHI